MGPVEATRLQAYHDCCLDLTPAVMRLTERMREMGVVQTHTSWGPDAPADDESRAEIIDTMLRNDAEDAAKTVSIRVSELRSIYAALTGVIDLSKTDLRTFLALSVEERTAALGPLEDLKRKLRALVEFPAMSAGQNLPTDVRKEVDDARPPVGPRIAILGPSYRIR